MNTDLNKWNKLRTELNNSYDYSSGWEKAIELFRSRVTDKFFKPIQRIIESREFKGEGFTILTAQCALIEFLAAFREGKVYNHKKGKASPNYEYRKSAELYVAFLHTADIFKDIFYTIQPNGNKVSNTPFDADDFYSEVRCGLLHEARTKGNWTINVIKNSKSEKVFLKQVGQKRKIYRTVLHYRLKHYVETYCSDLTQNNNQLLRRLFARKLDDLFDIPADPKKFDWWIDKYPV